MGKEEVYFIHSISRFEYVEPFIDAKVPVRVEYVFRVRVEYQDGSREPGMYTFRASTERGAIAKAEKRFPGLVQASMAKASKRFPG